jgi:hypothetical protein
MHQSNKRQPIRTCSCAMCRAGRGTKFGSLILSQANRRIRRAGKPAQLVYLMDYDGIPTPAVGAGYTD